jgi:hypothetical protein
MLSFDHYPWLRADGIPEGFWANLEVARTAALKAGVPMWAFCRTSVWEPYPDPTEAMLRFEVFADLVYGAQGICYFRYSGAGGIVNDDGTPTRHFPMVKRINRIVGAWGPTLLGLRSAGVYHAGPRPTASMGLGPDTIVRVASPDRQLVIGDFQHAGGDHYVMLMNPDWAQPRRWRVRFAPGVTALEEVSRQDGELYGPLHASDGLFDLTIMAGGARLFRVVCEGQ